MLRVGLTGGIASGKSHVAARLDAGGSRRLDLDRIGHELIAPGGAAHADVVAAFGASILAPDGGIDRKALGAIVFADAAARARLNALVHPRIRAEEARLCAGLSDAPGLVVVVEAALLVESGQHLRFHRLVVVHCGLDEQRRRLMKRDAIPEGAAELRLAAQMDPDLKRRFAHRVIDTSGSLVETARQADALALELRALAERVPARVRLDLARAARLASGPAGAAAATALAPERLLGHMAAGLSLEAVARDLGATRAWYAPSGDLPQPPDALAGCAALFALTQRGNDPDYAAAVAYSIACLTHTQPGDHARAVLATLALHDRTLGAESAPDERCIGRAERWSGVRPSPRAVAEVSASVRASAGAPPSAELLAATGRMLAAAAA